MPTYNETTDAAASAATVYSMAVGTTFGGRITAGDHDYVAITLAAGQTYTFSMVSTGAGSAHSGDPYLTLRNSAGTALASDDDSGPDTNATFTYTATTAGTYYLDAQGSSRRAAHCRAGAARRASSDAKSRLSR
jgi:serralysin